MKRRLHYLLHLALVSTLLFACKGAKDVQHLADVEMETYRIEDNDVEPSQEIEDIIAPYREKLQDEMDVVVGELEETITKSRPNSNMGNWFADVLEASAREIFPDSQIDFAVQNYGGLRVPSLASGPLTKGDIFELMPFDNTLVNIELNRNELQKLLDRIAEYGGWPISQSLSFSIKDTIATNIKINNEEIGDRNKFHVIMPDYVANGGDKCFFLTDCKREDSGKFIRKVVIDFLQNYSAEGQNFGVVSENRIKIIK